MKVLIVNTRHYPGGGDSAYTFHLADLLRKNGHGVFFFAMNDKRNVPDSNEDLFVSYIDFKELNKKKNLLTGFRVLARSIYSFEAKRKFSRLLSRIKPDIVHLQNIHAHITPSILFEAQERNIPVVWTLHDYKLICPNSHYSIDETDELCEDCGGGFYFKAVLRRCKKNSVLASTMATIEAYVHSWMRIGDRVDLFFTPSLFLRSKMLRRFPSGKLFHLPNFLPDEMFRQGNGRGEGYILSMGGVSRVKGFYPLMEACRKVPEIKLILLGGMDSDLQGRLQHLLPPNVSYLGMKHGAELKEILNGSVALIMPALNYENQPLSILEAFAAGKPVIASNLGGMSELVKDNERGFLVEPGDVHGLAVAMEKISSDTVRSAQMGRAAQDYVVRVHNSQSHYENLMQCYRSVIEMKNTKTGSSCR